MFFPTGKGLSRSRAYAIVQSCGAKALEEGRPFRKVVELNGEIKEYLSKEVLEKCFDLERNLQRVEEIFKRFEWYNEG